MKNVKSPQIFLPFLFNVSGMFYLDKVYKSYFFEDERESIYDKKKTNRRLCIGVVHLIRDIKKLEGELCMNWFKLKWCVHLLHATYRALWKITEVYSSCLQNEKCKSEFHNLVHGPRHISRNKEVLQSLFSTLDIKLDEVTMIYTYWNNDRLQDNITKVLCRVRRALELFVVEEKNLSNIIGPSGIPKNKNKWVLESGGLQIEKKH